MSEPRQIPPPLRLNERGKGYLQCPSCPRRWKLRARAAYELHWRLTHDVRRAQ